MEKNGKQVSLYVDTKTYKSSIHGSQDCNACHVGFDGEKIPHAEKISFVDCGQCHDVESFNKSVHGIAVSKGRKNAPACSSCHSSHAIQLASKIKKDIDVCLSCHNAGDIRQFKNSKHFTLRTSKSNVPTCSSCHGAVHGIQSSAELSALTARFNITGLCTKCHVRTGKAFQNTVHNAIFKNEKGKAPVCIDCHGAHSASTSKLTGESKDCLNCHLNQKVFEQIKGKGNLVTFVEQYQTSIHAKLRADGKEAATCIDGHFNHMIY